MNRLFVIVVEVAGGWGICVDRVGWKGPQAIIEAIKIQVAYISSRRRCCDIDCEVPTAIYWRSGSGRKVIMPLSSSEYARCDSRKLSLPKHPVLDETFGKTKP